MGSKNKSRRTKKRKLEIDDAKRLDVSKPKKKFEPEEAISSSCLTNILPTRQGIARQICIFVNQKEFTLVEGPIGSGKTFIAKYVAEQFGLQFKSMQMGEQVDSKSIFGSYICTEVVGQFKWKQSIFMQWVTEPTLILLEDIDIANSDVLSIFIEIARKREITLPNGENIQFHTDARLLATSSGKGKSNNILDSLTMRVRLESLSDKELERLVVENYPRCATLAKTLKTIFRELEALPVSGNNRLLTSSDFLRACARINELSDLSSNMDIFTEVTECWCLSELPERTQMLCAKVANKLTITPDQSAFHFGVRQPSMTHDDNYCIVGRCRLPRMLSLKTVEHHKLGHTRDILQLMERIAICIRENEPVLLVGETGVGKTSVIQALASNLNVTLKVVNLSPTSDSNELLEGYKPTSIGSLIEPFTQFYYDVFKSNLNSEQNRKFLNSLESCLNSGRYHDYLSLVEKTATKVLFAKSSNDPRWAEVAVRARKIREGIDKKAIPFMLARGAVLEAVQKGEWLLVDEINLAPPECLDAIVYAITSQAHPNFRLFACMNPATDAGKRRLPTSIRTKFTEFYVPETSDPHQLMLVVNAYLPSMKASGVENLVRFYLDAKKDFPYSYSLRTLCRALLFASDNIFSNEERSIFEAVSMAFLTNMNLDDKMKMKQKIQQTFKISNTLLHQPEPKTEEKSIFIKVENYWIECGDQMPYNDETYVLTKSVKENLAEIARIVASKRFPILLEGETSAGKTAIITYLGRATGNNVIRINNHEHTDIQEYMGSYVAGEEGRLIFAEGALVKAVKNGSWVILDELNLAPTDVIESLNRLLDDNRELFIPELNTTIKAHPRFRLFATQNPAGSYSGRKRLSRALLSRFIVLKFHHLPMEELAQMVCTRCKIAPSAADKMIKVLVELRNRRSLSGLFSARDGLMTLRDVFRWAKRLHDDNLCDDWLQVLVDHGYFLLAARCRNKKDELTVLEALEKIIKRKIEPESLFAQESRYFPKSIKLSNIVLTYGMRRMLVLVEQAWKHNEAVLVVGETGGGKTTLAEIMGKGHLMTLNCHEKTETADLLGRLRPRNNGGFEWNDGIVISAMKAGVPLLIDEISLAEDSVLERLNPLFEEERCLLLSDAGVDAHMVQSVKEFQLIATMNPGGDYGKKELSKALRNRFTEIWSSSEYKTSELIKIFDCRQNRCASNVKFEASRAGKIIVAWISEFFEKHSHVFRHAPSVRDVVACADLYKSLILSKNTEEVSIKEALSAVFLDALQSLPTRISIDINEILADADRILDRLLAPTETTIASKVKSIEIYKDRITIGKIDILPGKKEATVPSKFSLNAPTCISNFYRIARGLLISKPILLEGPPGSGKSSSVMALAQITGNQITRLNLSDQTDLSDLFGSDVPIVLPDGSLSFKWEDGPILKAIKQGEWILLDEMNLASQSVLEGLNSCFDHRKVLYIAELNRSFEIPTENTCRFFACQNPRAQGGNRRALPKSFVNRFTTIWIDDLRKDDISLILEDIDDKNILSRTQIHSMVTIISDIANETPLTGGPFTFNIRDLVRWYQLYKQTKNMSSTFNFLFVARLRKEEDKKKISELYSNIFREKCAPFPASLFIDKDKASFGPITLSRRIGPITAENTLLPSQMRLLSQLAMCVKNKWVGLIVGPRGCGKQTIVENLAHICGAQLNKISLTSETDAQELIGSYEQLIDQEIFNKAKSLIRESLCGEVDNCILERISNASSLVEMEVATELALSFIRNKPTIIEKCRLGVLMANRADVRFSWVDSTFVKAFTEGHWLVIKNVNLCSAAVLDRLNTCLENDGALVISERQASYEPIKPHKDFRIFLLMDPKYGEISRAMRNRCVEIYVTPTWNTVETDSTALAQNSGKELPKQISEALIKLPVDVQLQFCVLLREMTVEEACRMLNIKFHSDCISTIPLIPAPKLSELLSHRYTEWILKHWGSAESDKNNRLFWNFLSISTNQIQYLLRNSDPWFVDKFSSLLNKLPESSIPIDVRFIGQYMDDPDWLCIFGELIKLTVAQWSFRYAKSVECAIDSAEHLSKTLTKYEMSTKERNFTNLQLIATLSDAILDAFKGQTINGSEDKIFQFSIALILLIRTMRSPLTKRAGYAPIYIAWNFLRDYETIEKGELLSQALNLMEVGWTSKAYNEFVSKYIYLYKNHKMVTAFESKEDCERLSNEIYTEAEEYMEIGEPQAKEVNLHTTSLCYTIDFIKNARQVINYLYSFSIEESNPIFDGQNILLKIHWSSSQYEVFAKKLAFLNAKFDLDNRIQSLPSKGIFSLIISNFWEAIDFDIDLKSLLIGDLRQFNVQNIVDELWLVGSFSEQTDKVISNWLNGFSNEIPNWASANDDALKGRLVVALKILTKAIPPNDTIDPIIYEEERSSYLAEKLKFMEEQIQLLRKWRIGMSLQSEDCDLNSTHPIIQSLLTTKKELLSELQNCTVREKASYRQSSNQYASLCGEIRAFYQLVNDVSKIIQTFLNSDQIADSESSLILAQLHSFEMSSNSFKMNILKKYTPLVDISMPFLIGIELFRCVIFEIVEELKTSQKYQNLKKTTAFPLSYTFQNSDEGPISQELLTWSCREGSPMPLKLKVAVISKRIAESIDPQVDLEWTRKEWKKWYEKNVAKAAQKEYVYREKTEEQKEELEIEEFFESISEYSDVLSPEDICMLLHASFPSEYKKQFDHNELNLRYNLALTWIRQILTSLGKQEADIRELSISSELKLLKSIHEIETVKGSSALDVYRHTSILEIRKAIDLLEALSVKTRLILERWPEIVPLKMILETINLFMETSTATPHIKITANLESILEQCDEWEKLADRANSLHKELAPLQLLLVDWKKMEISSWSYLLSRTENDAYLSAQLVAFPLFEAIFNFQTMPNETDVLAMAAQWIHDGTLLDFSARINSIKMLSTWSRMLNNAAISVKLESLAAHFEQFSTIIEAKLNEFRMAAEQELKDYIKITKYNDLNLRNIKVQAHKSRTHLYKIIKRFKANTIIEASICFDELLNIDKLTDKDEIHLFIDIPSAEVEEHKIIKKAKEISEQILAQANIACNYSQITSLTENVESCSQSLRTLINYDQYEDTKSKEKAQGYARNSRQREVALIIKTAQVVGLNARRAVILSQEKINQDSIFGLAVGGEREKLLRSCSAGRNTCIKKALNINNQVGTSTRSHFTGLVEYGISWMLKLHLKLYTFKEQLELLEKSAIALSNTSINILGDHKQLKDLSLKLRHNTKSIGLLIKAMKVRISLIPSSELNIDEQIKIHLNPLCCLHKDHPAFDEVQNNVYRALEICNKLHESANLIMKSEQIGIFNLNYVISLYADAKANSKHLRSTINSLKPYFEREVQQILNLLEPCENIFEQNFERRIQQTEIDPLPILILIQTIYKSTVDNNLIAELKLIDRYEALSQILIASSFSKINSWLHGIISDIINGVLPQNLKELTKLVEILVQLGKKLFALLSANLQQIGILYFRMLSLIAQLFEQGYVNTIPKEGKQEDANGKTDDIGEGGGMGEGKSGGDAKDVTDEMEESGQIEGLENEEKDSACGDPGKNEKPIDMDEDFAEDLQNIDKNDEGGEKSDEEDNEEPENEDQMGDVNDADDTQLDPELWDNEETDKQKDIDQDNAGANNETDQLAAKEEDSQSENKQDEKGKDEEINNEPEEILENVDEREKENVTDLPEISDKDINEIEDFPNEEISLNDEMDISDNEEEANMSAEASDAEVEEADANEKNEQEEIQDNTKNENEQQDDQNDVIEQGIGGKKKESDTKDNNDGQVNEEEEEGMDGDGKRQSDKNGNNGNGDDKVERETIGEDNEEVEVEPQKDRELATNDEEMVDAEPIGKGEENDAGKIMDDSIAQASKQMHGAGSVEEAKKSKNQEKESQPKKTKPLLESKDFSDTLAVDNRDAQEESEAAIHLAPEDIFQLGEELTNGLILGKVDEGEQEETSAQESQKLQSFNDSEKVWREINRSVGILSAELAENLRLILEPQKASKMQGDYRTGKRLNMRRLIPYIASDYRKDRIWMRRTKKTQRNYQVLIAVDDSASMNENGIHQVTCEAVCAIDDALRRCDAGVVSVISFGSQIKSICDFGEQITSGKEFIEKLTFDQSATDLLGMLAKSRNLLGNIQSSDSEQLLIIISDGRGAFAQGADKIKRAIFAMQSVTVLFVIIDSGPKSILDLSVASFKEGSAVLTPYLSVFPFPFYALVKTINQLPSILAESIRQWFERSVQET